MSVGGGCPKAGLKPVQEFTADLQSESGRKNCFRIVRQMSREEKMSLVFVEKKCRERVFDADGMRWFTLRLWALLSHF